MKFPARITIVVLHLFKLTQWQNHGYWGTCPFPLPQHQTKGGGKCGMKKEEKKKHRLVTMFIFVNRAPAPCQLILDPPLIQWLSRLIDNPSILNATKKVHAVRSNTFRKIILKRYKTNFVHEGRIYYGISYR